MKLIDSLTCFTYFACLLAFVVQVSFVHLSYFRPDQVSTVITEKKLDKQDYPVVFKICVEPGWNASALKEAGYASPREYFSGESRYNRSEYGWAGHGEPAGVRQVLAKARLHTLEEAIDSVVIWTLTNEPVNVPLSHVALWRVNFPYNCYTLDISDNVDVREKGVKTLYIGFPLLANRSVQIHVQGANLACNRDVKEHKFQSAGDGIELSDLGKFGGLMRLKLPS
jgi:hypothetical protein